MKMSNERYQLHWITAIISVLKTLKEMIIPIILLIFVNGVNDTGKWYWDYLIFIIFGVSLIIFLITGFIKWKRYVYWFEDNELRIEYGLFVKKKRYIPFERIQSLDYVEGLLHRPFKLVKVKVETAGSTASLKAEAELTAITKEAAEKIEERFAEAKRQQVPVSTDIETEEEYLTVQEVPKSIARHIFTMTTQDLFVLATTSGGIGLILSGIFVFLSQFSDVLPIESIYNEVSVVIKSGLILISLIVLVGLFIIWCISVLMTFLAYYNFSVQLEGENIVITRGLIEKRRVTIPLKRVQSVRIVESPFRQIFGYATVIIDNAGGGIEGEGVKIKLLPLVRRGKIQAILKELFPELITDAPTHKLPSRGKRFYYRIQYVWTVPLVIGLSYYFYPYGLLSLIIIPLVIALGVWRHYSGAYLLMENQLTLRFRGISLNTVFMKKKQIQSMQIRQNYFHKKRQVATIDAAVKSGQLAFYAEVKYMDEQEAKRIFDWYKPKAHQVAVSHVEIEESEED